MKDKKETNENGDQETDQALQEAQDRAWVQMIEAAHAIADAFAGVNDQDIVKGVLRAAGEVLDNQWDQET